MKLKYQIPEIYQKLFPADILRMDPVETKATCDACIMARPKNRGKVFYLDNLKCCTFYPFLPNYTVGAILSKPELVPPAVLEKIRSKIKNGEYALPLGLVAPPSYQVPFNHRKENEFGQRADWLCPYFDHEKQNCGIWRNRGAVCTSFYCKSSFGSKGLKFWDAVSNYMTYTEMALMEEALVMLDFSPRQISDQLEYLNRHEATKAEMKSSCLPEKKARVLWNGYYEDPEGFYKKCFEIVKKLDRKAYRELAGDPGQNIENNLRRAYAKIQPQEV